MKKGFKTLAAAALVVSALTPVAAAAASNVEPGVYTATNYYTLAEFKKLSSAEKAAALQAAGTVVVLAEQVYKAADVLTASDSALPGLATSVDTYTTPEGNKLVSGKPLNAAPEAIKVESVSAINQTVYNTGTQELAIQINGNQSVTVKQLNDAGYTVLFESNKGIFDSNLSGKTLSTTGKLGATLVAGDANYTVTIQKGEEKFTSQTGKITIVDAAATATITDYKLEVNGTKLTSTTLNTKDTNIKISATKGTNVKGEVIETFKGTTTYTSSNPEVALVDTAGNIQVVQAGTATITIKNGNATKTVTLTVTNTARTLTTLKAEETSVGLVVGVDKTLSIKGYDQFGDEIGLTGIIVSSSNASVAAATYTSGSNFNVAAKAVGTTTVTIQVGEKTTALLVTVGEAKVSTYKLELVKTTNQSEDNEIDVAKAGKDDKVTVAYNGYNASNQLVGATKLAAYTSGNPQGEFSYVVTVKDVASTEKGNYVTETYDSTKNTLTLTALKAGTATVTIYDGALKVASYDVVLKDSSPAVATAKFETVAAVTSTEDVALIKASNLTFSPNVDQTKVSFVLNGTTAGDIKVDGKLAGTFEVYSAVTSGDTVSVSVTSSDTVNVKVTQGSGKETTGDITISIKNLKGEIVGVRTYKVNIPKP